MKFIKHYFSKKVITEGVKDSYFSSFAKYLHSPYLWRMDCHSLARGVAIGLFTAVLPIVPFQTILSIMMCFVFGANLPFAFLVSWINNPITYVPILLFTYGVGKLIIGEKIANYSATYLLGLLVVSLSIAAIGYVATVLIYKISNYFKLRYHNRKR